MVLDLHRDAAAEGSAQMDTSAQVNGKESAQLMIEVGTDAGGLHHPHWQENLALALKLKKTDGEMMIGGKKVVLFQPGAAYLTCYITAAITAVLLVAPLALGAAVAYYAIWVMAAWLFILAVYFTSKLM